MWVETLVMAAALGVIAAFFLVDERYRDHIRFGGSVLGATGAALAAVFGYGQLHEFERSHAFEVEQHREVVRHRRQAVSFGFIDHFQEVSRPEVHELAKRLRTLGDEEMIRLVNDRTEDGAMIEEILNFFEHMALAANSRYADEKVLCRYFRSIPAGPAAPGAGGVGALQYARARDLVEGIRSHGQEVEEGL